MELSSISRLSRAVHCDYWHSARFYTMAPKKRELNEREWHLLMQTTRKSLERTFKARGFPPVLPKLTVRVLPGGGGYELGGAPRYWEGVEGSDQQYTHFGWRIFHNLLVSIKADIAGFKPVYEKKVDERWVYKEIFKTRLLDAGVPEEMPEAFHAHSSSSPRATRRFSRIASSARRQRVPRSRPPPSAPHTEVAGSYLNPRQ